MRKCLDIAKALFPDIANVLTEDDVKLSSPTVLKEDELVSLQQSPVDDIIYATHPKYGFPYNGRDTSRAMLDQSVAIELQKRELGHSPSDKVAVTDADVSLEMMQRRFESNESYSERMKSVARDEFKKSNKKSETE